MCRQARPLYLLRGDTDLSHRFSQAGPVLTALVRPTHLTAGIIHPLTGACQVPKIARAGAVRAPGRPRSGRTHIYPQNPLNTRKPLNSEQVRKHPSARGEAASSREYSRVLFQKIPHEKNQSEVVKKWSQLLATTRANAARTRPPFARTHIYPQIRRPPAIPGDVRGPESQAMRPDPQGRANT